jgi:hypothetical protein
MATAELLRRLNEFSHIATQREISADGLAKSVAANWNQKRAAFAGITESGISARKPAEVKALLKQGLSVVLLAPASSKNASVNSSDGMEAARSGGLTALIPFDFATPNRVEKWGSQGVVYAPFADVADAPADVRDGLLRSKAFILLELTGVPTKGQLEAIAPFHARLVHLNFAGLPSATRESTARQVIQAMYDAGLTREQILQLTGRNLRRYLATRASSGGMIHD